MTKTAWLGRSIWARLCEDLVDYLKAFDVTLSVLQEDWALERVAYELIADAHADGVRYIEIRYCPVLHLNKGLRDTQVVEAVLAGMGATGETLGWTRSGSFVAYATLTHPPRCVLRASPSASRTAGSSVLTSLEPSTTTQRRTTSKPSI